VPCRFVNDFAALLFYNVPSVVLVGVASSVGGNIAIKVKRAALIGAAWLFVLDLFIYWCSANDNFPAGVSASDFSGIGGR
jgi:hypothetical protein